MERWSTPRSNHCTIARPFSATLDLTEGLLLDLSSRSDLGQRAPFTPFTPFREPRGGHVAPGS
jgi:hypothetical protein